MIEGLKWTFPRIVPSYDQSHVPPRPLMGPLCTPSPCGPLILPDNSCPLPSTRVTDAPSQVPFVLWTLPQPRAASPDQFVSNATDVPSFIHSFIHPMSQQITIFPFGLANTTRHSQQQRAIVPRQLTIPTHHRPLPAPRLDASFPLQST